LALLSLPRGLALLAALVAPWPLIGAFGHAAGLRAAIVNDQLAWYLPRSLGGAVLVAPLQNAFGILFPWVLLTPLIVVQAVGALILVLAVIGLAAAAAVALSPATRRRSRAFTLACVVAAIAAIGGYRADTHRPTTEEFGRLEAQVQPLAGQGGAVVVWDVAD